MDNEVEYAIERVKRFANMKGVQKADRVSLGLRYSIDELLQLVAGLTGKRVLLVDEADSTSILPQGAELALAEAGKPCGDYRFTVVKSCIGSDGITNENDDQSSEFNNTIYPKATGVVFMVGKEKPAMALTVETFPIVGEDLVNDEGDMLPLWDFIKYNGRYAYSPEDGGGGTGSKTPPPGA
ncbi:MAG: hypothetical protein BGO21_02555 [Dyadobacter sp. 50-39]|uniref:hypothetical protein n=1 Tax=Dyadobacter sp. 50-39 TaxID=1895756 RepID=UPI000965FC2E|nr:hypothetical protein [Dyadobacter sp. 50-39]OJV12645.1 MAG: hypothetical protein BGO21_02555 [Dyadobacter sp. 50-39]